MHRIVLLLLLIASLMANARAAIVVGAWTPLFKGVDFATGGADASEPVLQAVQALRIDLSDPDIAFFSTPSNGTNSLESFGQTTSTFLTNYGLQVAVNANFFSPCCAATPNEPKDLLGLAVSQGDVVSPQTTSGTGAQVLLITRSNLASILVTSPAINTANVYTAVAGSAVLVKNGVNQGDFDTLNPRTAVGISQDNRYMYLITIDGRQSGYSDGADLHDTGAWLLRFGAYTGLNLDGGGSTTMVKAEGSGAKLLNKPSGGTQRIVGNNLGVFALPLAPIITSQPQNQTIFVGQNATFTVTAGGAAPLAYQWKFNGLPLAGATNTFYTRTNAQFGDSGTYTVVITNSSATLVSSPARLIVTNEIIIANPGPAYDGVWTIGSSSLDKYGSYYKYAATTIGDVTATATYIPNLSLAGKFDVSIWYPAGTNRTANAQVTISANGGAFRTSLDQTTGGGMWQLLAEALDFAAGSNDFVQISNDTGEINKVVIADALRFVYLSPPAITLPLADAIVSTGTNIYFDTTATGHAPLSYQWFYNGSKILGATNHLLSLLNVQPTDSGSYSLVVSNIAGTANTQASLLVNPPAPPQIKSITQLSDHRFRLLWEGSANVTYTIEASTNLVNWITLTNLSSQAGIFEFTDSATTNFAWRFYRARWAP